MQFVTDCMAAFIMSSCGPLGLLLRDGYVFATERSEQAASLKLLIIFEGLLSFTIWRTTPLSC
jgi:hypothetical protein